MRVVRSLSIAVVIAAMLAPGFANADPAFDAAGHEEYGSCGSFPTSTGGFRGECSNQGSAQTDGTLYAAQSIRSPQQGVLPGGGDQQFRGWLRSTQLWTTPAYAIAVKVRVQIEALSFRDQSTPLPGVVFAGYADAYGGLSLSATNYGCIDLCSDGGSMELFPCCGEAGVQPGAYTLTALLQNDGEPIPAGTLEIAVESYVDLTMYNSSGSVDLQFQARVLSVETRALN